ncbi:hypothetical protein Y032_0004g1770 [Ancylostoma ceylanicum]|nr:hypothetical protein Y032_0004g1770 [Ancylostoma ceylanicum]
MASLYFIALAVISLFPALCGGLRAFCPSGQLDKVTIERDILTTVNARRHALIKGKQQNGRTGTNLPPARGMTNVRWDCELERTANDVLSKTCSSKQRFNSKGLADFFYHEYDPNYNYGAGKVLQNALNAYLLQIDLYHLDVPSGSRRVSYNGNEQLKTYANLVRSKNTKIGCAINRCFWFGEDSKFGDGAAMYCVLNSR